jgi:hypothetical protein
MTPRSRGKREALVPNNISMRAVHDLAVAATGAKNLDVTVIVHRDKAASTWVGKAWWGDTGKEIVRVDSARGATTAKRALAAALRELVEPAKARGRKRK